VTIHGLVLSSGQHVWPINSVKIKTEYQLRLGRRRQVVHSVSGWTRGVQVKLWNPLRTRAIPERLRSVFMTKRYTNPRLRYVTSKHGKTDSACKTNLLRTAIALKITAAQSHWKQNMQNKIQIN